MSTKYFVCGNLNHDGTEYKRGDTISLEDAQARPLTEAGVIQREAPQDEPAKENVQEAPTPERTPTVGGERIVSGEPSFDIDTGPAAAPEQPGLLRRIFGVSSTAEGTGQADTTQIPAAPVSDAIATTDVKTPTEPENDPSANL